MHTGEVCNQTYIQRNYKQTDGKLTADVIKLYTNYALIYVVWTSPTPRKHCYAIMHLIKLSYTTQCHASTEHLILIGCGHFDLLPGKYFLKY